MDYNRFSEEEISICRNTDLVMVCERLGYKVKKQGRVHTIEGMDSLKIFNRRSFTRFSSQESGDSITFLRLIEKMEWKEAVEWLLDFNGCPHIESNIVQSETFHKLHIFNWTKAIVYPTGNIEFIENKSNTQVKTEVEVKEPFVLPTATIGNIHIRQYLCEERCLSEDIVDFFIEKGMVYESAMNQNVVFVGRDQNGTARHASLRGTYQHEGQKAFKGSVTGSDTTYTFNFINIQSDRLVVCEAPIDCMSYMDLFGELSAPMGPSNYLALTGIHDRSLERFLRDNGHIKEIVLALDSDTPGQEACRRIAIKYSQGEWKDREFRIEISPPVDFKDYNEMLVALRKHEKCSLCL